MGKTAVVRVGLYRHADGGGGGGGKAASQWRGDEGVGGVVRATAARGETRLVGDENLLWFPDSGCAKAHELVQSGGQLL